MDEQDTRRAVNAAINDQMRGFANGWILGFCILAFFAHPLLGIGLLLLWLVSWGIWSTARYYLSPSERAFRRDRAEWLALHSRSECWLVGDANSEADYLRRRPENHPSDWKPFEEWRKARRHARR